MREQFSLLARQIPICYAIILVNSLVMSALVSTHVPFLVAFLFPGVAIPIMVRRLFIWRRHVSRLASGKQVAQMRKALHGTFIAANVLATILAAWAIAVMLSLPAGEFAAVPLFTILSMLTCAYCLSSYPAAAYSVLISGSTYILIAMLLTGDPVLMAMAFNIALVSAMFVYMVSHQYQQLRRIVNSRSQVNEQRLNAQVLAHRDSLTGLPNRRALIEALQSHRKSHPDSPVGLVMIDMNGFKPVNDTYGHAAGDQLLIIIGERLVAAVGKDGIAARLGGDEFCIFLQHPVDLEWVHARAETIRRTINEPILLEEHQLRVGASIGIATGMAMPENPTDLLRQADIALYDAKARGENAIGFYEGRLEERVRRRTLIEQALADREQMSAIGLHYQPIFEQHTGRQVSFEALARWQHLELGNVSPAEFIEAAERNGSVQRLTLHLFRQAIAAARQWDESLHLSFNLSGSGLCNAGFEHSLPKIMREAGFPPERLTLEVTETALLTDTAASWAILEQLQKLGVKIVLDDFGAGHASIGYLRDLRLDGIKLDGSLVRDITHDSRSRQLLYGVLQLCRSIGVTVTAEMIETPEQLLTLQAYPVDYVQGFLLGRPTPDPIEDYGQATVLTRQHLHNAAGHSQCPKRAAG